jgi:hypothetical protein
VPVNEKTQRRLTAKVLNHADTDVPLRYPGITRQAVLQAYDAFEL